MIRIAIVEDEGEQRQLIRTYLDRFAEETGMSFEVVEFQDGVHFLFHYQPIYDIIFMDIEMPDIDGMEAARKLREQDKEAVLIFVTNMAQYAIQGYKVQAQSYLLKPVSYYGLYPELQDAVETVQKRKKRMSLLLPVEDELIKLPVSDICFIESRRHNLLIHTKGKTYTIRDTMKHMEQQLEQEPFAHSSVSFLVNLAHVSSVRETEAVVGGERVPISRQKRKLFMNALMHYIGGGQTDGI